MENIRNIIFIIHSIMHIKRLSNQDSQCFLIDWTQLFIKDLNIIHLFIYLLKFVDRRGKQDTID